MIAVAGAAAGAALIASALWPAAEIALAQAALRGGDRVSHALAVGRTVERIAPAAMLLVLVLRLLSGASRRRTGSRARFRAIAFLVLTFALGPGLLVNGLLKSLSHRPRPLHTAQVMGAGDDYRPFYAFDGGCRRNCSFSSGETAGAFWMVAPALLTPPQVRPAAVAAGLAFGTIAGAMRIAAGAHFLSDVAFSALAALLLILAAYRILRIRDDPQRADALRPPRAEL